MTEMTEDLMDYPRLVQNALRGVARQALVRVEEEGGLPGAHHFYLSFKTQHPDVVVPGFLRDRYPEEMTVVLQHQFWNLVVGDPGFEVTLAFGGRQERVGVPWEALTAFYDPSVSFGVRFEPGAEEAAGGGPRALENGTGRDAPSSADAESDGDGAGGNAANVVSFDEFKKKK